MGNRASFHVSQCRLNAVLTKMTKIILIESSSIFLNETHVGLLAQLPVRGGCTAALPYVWQCLKHLASSTTDRHIWMGRNIKPSRSFLFQLHGRCFLIYIYIKKIHNWIWKVKQKFMYVKCFIKTEGERRTWLAEILGSSHVRGGQDGQGRRLLCLKSTLGFRIQKYK